LQEEVKIAPARPASPPERLDPGREILRNNGNLSAEYRQFIGMEFEAHLAADEPVPKSICSSLGFLSQRGGLGCLEFR
jgi:hypothetical protein